MDVAAQSALLPREENEGAGGGEDNESGALADLVTAPPARSGPIIAKSRDERGGRRWRITVAL